MRLLLRFDATMLHLSPKLVTRRRHFPIWAPRLSAFVDQRLNVEAELPATREKASQPFAPVAPVIAIASRTSAIHCQGFPYPLASDQVQQNSSKFSD